MPGKEIAFQTERTHVFFLGFKMPELGPSTGRTVERMQSSWTASRGWQRSTAASPADTTQTTEEADLKHLISAKMLHVGITVTFGCQFAATSLQNNGAVRPNSFN